MSFITLLVAALSAMSLGAVEVSADWKIVVPETGNTNVDHKIGIAAEELKVDLKDACGHDLEIVKSWPGKGAFRFGAAAAANAGFDVSGLKNWDNVWAEKDGNVYFFGKDRCCRIAPKYPWQECELPSVRAMTRFLRDVAGVKYVNPDRNGVAITKRGRLEIAAGAKSGERPWTIYGSCRFVEQELVNGLANGFWPMGSFRTFGGHIYPVAVPQEEYFKTHPEYFAMNRSGKRALGPTRLTTPLCISNPAVEELIVARMKREFDNGADVCQLAQHDGLGICHCENCRAFMGTGDDWNEKIWLFHRRIAERLEKERPGKIVHILSYAFTGNPPKTFRTFPKNVMIELCRYSLEDFLKWKGYEVPQGFTVYTYLWGDYQYVGFTPKRSFHALKALVKLFKANDVRGIYRCYNSDRLELPGIEGPQYWLFNRFLEDDGLSIPALLKEYCDAAYGERAGEKMVQFFDELDTRLRAFDRMSTGHSEANDPTESKYANPFPQEPLEFLGFVYTPKTLEKLEGLLSQAESLVEPGSREAKRLGRVRDEFTFAAHMGRIANLYHGYLLNPVPELLKPLAESVKARSVFMDALFGGKDKIAPTADWPTTPLFGGTDRKKLHHNGRLEGICRGPLDWNFDFFVRNGICPGAPGETAQWRAYDAAHPPAVKVSGWKPVGSGLPPSAEFRTADTGFDFSPGTNGDLRVTTTVAVKPNTRYRLDYYARWKDVIVNHPREGGFYMLVYYDRHPAFVKDPPTSIAHNGTSEGWRHGTLEFTSNARGKVEVIGRLLFCSGHAEVRDVTLREADKL